MRPPTHDNPNAIPRNGTDVPWVELPDPAHARRPQHGRGDGGARDAEVRRR
jgi:hypothetical protein